MKRKLVWVEGESFGPGLPTQMVAVYMDVFPGGFTQADHDAIRPMNQRELYQWCLDTGWSHRAALARAKELRKEYGDPPMPPKRPSDMIP